MTLNILILKKASVRPKYYFIWGQRKSDASFRRIDKNKFVFSILRKKISLKKKIILNTGKKIH